MKRKNAVTTTQSVFLNIPYDQRFKKLYLAYIAGLVHMGFVPRVTLGLSGGTRRLEKILAEIQGCEFSIHDLSRVGLDRGKPFVTPRFNMPFELGLAVAWEKTNPKRHKWFVFEEKAYRVQKSLSDLNGTDPHIHDGKVEGVLRELCNAFTRGKGQPTVPDMMKTFRAISRRAPSIIGDTGARDLFEARVFQELCWEAKIASGPID